uniref:TIL domain-containing protein n=1 Tax=Strongyloides stercoralis TaxID=6248 RepID=A0AAF5CYN4_STRER
MLLYYSFLLFLNIYLINGHINHICIECGKNLSYSASCVSPCPPRCSISLSEPCYKKCTHGGCECRHPFALDEYDNCILRRDCPKKSFTTIVPTITTTKKPMCKGNLVYSKCRQRCETRCSDKKERKCGVNCRSPGCECKYPFVRDKKNKCIHKSMCPGKPSSTTKKPTTKATTKTTTETTTKTTTKKATKPTTKPPGKKCPKNMKYSKCPSKCIRKCLCEEDRCNCMKLGCDKPKCVCKEGYILYLGKCITEDKCKSLEENFNVYSDDMMF